MRNCSPPDERRPQGPQTHRQTLIMSSLSSVSGTKLSPHAQNCPFQPVLPEQGELCTARTTTTPSRENFVPHPAPNPAQNSPSTPTPAAQPVQNSPNTRKIAHFSPFCPSRENFVPLAPPRSRAGRTLYRAQCQTRYKTPPTRPRQQPNRYKTLPTRPKLPISACFARARRTLYRHHHDPQQEELCTARTTTTPSRENFVPHQQPNRYKTLPTRPQMPISVRFARAGKTLYRRHHQEAEQGELCTAPCAKPGTKLPQHTHTSSPTGTKLPQHAPASSPTGTKLSQRPVLQRFREKVRPAHPKAAFFASFAPAGRIISRTGDRTGSADEGRMR